MKAFGFWFDVRYLSLSRRIKDVDHEGEGWMELFSLRCCLCRRWTFGCGETEHLFCGMCAGCVYEP
jgi:hypothetical protein